MGPQDQEPSASECCTLNRRDVQVQKCSLEKLNKVISQYDKNNHKEQLFLVPIKFPQIGLFVTLICPQPHLA